MLIVSGDLRSSSCMNWFIQLEHFSCRVSCFNGMLWIYFSLTWFCNKKLRWTHLWSRRCWNSRPYIWILWELSECFWFGVCTIWYLCKDTYFTRRRFLFTLEVCICLKMGIKLFLSSRKVYLSYILPWFLWYRCCYVSIIFPQVLLLWSQYPSSKKYTLTVCDLHKTTIRYTD